ncbi:molecular chaperone GroES [Streptomonospora alba]|uniref:Molecular chaperone GroES n=1 Tax=Streptomonospora alba TaxID=183763 RepID=A0A0C2FKP9_9ACTN|nr:quinone oxidoreductase [Streptomonospora alba]KIH99904.1 molecular chaperone GroES [Streptomonospora alba]
MFAITAARIDKNDPLSGLEAGERPDPAPPEGWTTVRVKAAALNHHDLWSLRGVGLPEERLPMVLGCDAAGLDEEGNEVIVHAVIGDPDAGGGDETRDPRRSLLSEVHPGTLAQQVAVPRRNLVPKPAELSFEEAACLPTAWLTAYRMLFARAGLEPGSTVLVQGAGGGVSSALIRMAAAVGHRVYATSRDEGKRDRALQLGAYGAVASGERLPEKVDVVFDSVGEATWGHSLRSLRPGGRIVTCGATSGDAPKAELNRMFFLQLSVVGSTMGSRDELRRLAEFCARTGVRPEIDRTLPLDDAREGFAAMDRGELFGKIVFQV